MKENFCPHCGKPTEEAKSKDDVMNELMESFKKDDKKDDKKTPKKNESAKASD